MSLGMGTETAPRLHESPAERAGHRNAKRVKRRNLTLENAGLN